MQTTDLEPNGAFIFIISAEIISQLINQSVDWKFMDNNFIHRLFILRGLLNRNAKHLLVQKYADFHLLGSFNWRQTK